MPTSACRRPGSGARRRSTSQPNRLTVSAQRRIAVTSSRNRATRLGAPLASNLIAPTNVSFSARKTSPFPPCPRRLDTRQPPIIRAPLTLAPRLSLLISRASRRMCLASSLVARSGKPNLQLLQRLSEAARKPASERARCRARIPTRATKGQWQPSAVRRVGRARLGSSWDRKHLVAHGRIRIAVLKTMPCLVGCQHDLEAEFGRNVMMAEGQIEDGPRAPLAIGDVGNRPSNFVGVRAESGVDLYLEPDRVAVVKGLFAPAVLPGTAWMPHVAKRGRARIREKMILNRFSYKYASSYFEIASFPASSSGGATRPIDA